MNSNRFLKIVVGILLILNIGTLGFIWIRHGHMDTPPRHDRGDVAGFLTHELMLNDTQLQQFLMLREEHHHAAEQLQEEGRALHQHFFDLLHGQSPDSSLIQQAANAIAANQKQLDLVTFYHFQNVRAICTPGQQKKFDEVINEALRIMAPKPQGHHPR